MSQAINRTILKCVDYCYYKVNMKERDKVREKSKDNVSIRIHRLWINLLESFPTHDNTYHGRQRGMGKQIQVTGSCAYLSIYNFVFP